MPLDVEHGPPGTRFAVHLQGVGWTETTNIYTVVYDNSYVGYTFAFNSQGDVEIPLQRRAIPAGISSTCIRRSIAVKNSGRKILRSPQLTYAADHPGEDLPRFRFAFEGVTEE